MFQLPPIPTWDGLHPLIIHFPIVLLLIAPVFVLIGAVLQPKIGKYMYFAALLLMVLGTASTFIAVGTGEAAGKLADRSPAINATLEQHEKLAESTRMSFSILTVAFALLLALPKLMKWEPSRMLQSVVPLLFLVLYGAGAMVLVNTAHQGGMLVHQHGVHALLAPGSTPATAPAETPHEGD